MLTQIMLNQQSAPRHIKFYFSAHLNQVLLSSANVCSTIDEKTTNLEKKHIHLIGDANNVTAELVLSISKPLCGKGHLTKDLFCLHSCN